MSVFVEFAGKKEYKCPKCKAVIRYAKFFGADKKVLTTDGKEPYFDRDRKPMSNTGWPTDPLTKQMHECGGDNSGNTSALKTDVGHNSQPRVKEIDFDALISEKEMKRAYADFETIYNLKGLCKQFLRKKGETDPPEVATSWMVGMLIQMRRGNNENIQST